MQIIRTSFATAVAMAAAVAWAQPPGDGPQYTDEGALVLPSDYRAWPFIGAGLGLTYEGENGTPTQAANPNFSHAFVNPTAYRYFTANGRWPDRTVFILEFRSSASAVSINTSGHFATDLVLLEAEVKDARFEDGWAYFVFGSRGNVTAQAARLPADRAAPCVECHTEHGAVERTFVQFYPTLLEIARQKGTLKPGF